MSDYTLIQDDVYKPKNYYMCRKYTAVLCKIVASIIIPAILPFTIAFFNYRPIFGDTFWESIALVYMFELILVCVYTLVGSCRVKNADTESFKALDAV